MQVFIWLLQLFAVFIVASILPSAAEWAWGKLKTLKGGEKND